MPTPYLVVCRYLYGREREAATQARVTSASSAAELLEKRRHLHIGHSGELELTASLSGSEWRMWRWYREKSDNTRGCWGLGSFQGYHVEGLPQTPGG